MATDRLVIVPEVVLDDLCRLADRACQRINVTTAGPEDSLVLALRGSVREVRTHSLLDPVG